MKILFLGEITGRCGTGVIKNCLRKYRTDKNIDFVIADGESVTGGYGLGFQNALTLLHMGIDVLTTGEKCFYKPDMVENIAKKDRILRPANYPESVPGRGVRYYYCADKKICVINFLGMFGFSNPHLNNPFLAAEGLVEKIKKETPFVLVTFHSQATAEKTAMGYLLAGKASAVVGSHTKALSADGRILEGGTAYISDTGRCGASQSVGGFDPEGEIKKYRTGFPVRSHESWQCPQMQGFLVSLDDSTGLATEVETIRIDVEVEKL